MYAHRNEDIVNTGRLISSNNDKPPQEKGGDIMPLPLSIQDKNVESMKKQHSNSNKKTKDSKNRTVEKRKAADHNHTQDGKREEEDGGGRKQKKTHKYGLLAEFRGMGELEFSKWLLSAPPSERKQVLQDYNNYLQKKKER